MTIRVIRDEKDAERLSTFLKAQNCVLTVKIEKGEHRTKPQNRLLAQWIKDIAGSEGEKVENVRARLKLIYGVPILKIDDETFANRFDTATFGLDYKTKLLLMKEPFNMPVTSVMTISQFNQFLSDVERAYLKRGYILTNPDDLKWKEQ